MGIFAHLLLLGETIDAKMGEIPVGIARHEKHTITSFLGKLYRKTISLWGQ